MQSGDAVELYKQAKQQLIDDSHKRAEEKRDEVTENAKSMCGLSLLSGLMKR